MNTEKEQILNNLATQNYDTMDADIQQYKEKYPYDTDMMLLESFYLILQGKTQQAQNILLNSIQHAPYDVDSYYLLAETYAAFEKTYEAIKYYSIAHLLYKYYKENYLFFNEEDCDQKVDEMNSLWLKNLKSDDSALISKTNAEIDMIKYQVDKNFELFDDMMRTTLHLIGDYYYRENEPIRFGGYFNSVFNLMYHNPNETTLKHTTGEFLDVLFEGTCCNYNGQLPALLPIAAKDSDTVIQFKDSKQTETLVSPRYPHHFNYYRIEDSVDILTNKSIIIGNPVVLKQNPERKKLVISLFTDGLAQTVLHDEGLEKVMPNTYQFFSKGLICDNFFTSSDWTYPSIASFVSGYHVPNHMMVLPNVNRSLPTKSKTLFERLHDAGYYTAMFNGDWRSTGSNGYLRGIDRYVAQHACFGMRTEQLLGNVIDHIEAFKETNQYIWLCTGVLHDVADEFDLPVSVQSKLHLKECSVEEASVTSVKQNYSINKRIAYIHYLKQLDTQLEMLYHYLEMNYNDEDYVVTMFGDHGQTYLIPTGEHHLCRHDSNVGFMVRGGEFSGHSTEYMSAVDYPNILCKLANTPEPVSDTDGVLPKTFGGTKCKPFTISETVHPGDPYMASIHAEDHTFYFTSKDLLTPYAKIELGEYTATLLNANGEEWDNSELKAYYIQYIKEHIRYLCNY